MPSCHSAGLSLFIKDVTKAYTDATSSASEAVSEAASDMKERNRNLVEGAQKVATETLDLTPTPTP